ncbi:hypothetical protein CHUAL_000322 [Chamberlinius hualienensis]
MAHFLSSVTHAVPCSSVVRGHSSYEDRGRLGQTKASLSLQSFLGVESGFTLDKESNTLAILCRELVVVVAFDTRELLIEWQVKINSNLGEDQQYVVDVAHVPPKSRLSLGAARLHVTDGTFCLTAGLPPRLQGDWQLANLRRYGVVSGKFCFEGGSRCGKGEGLHVLLHSQPECLSTTFDLASQGKLNLTNRLFIRKTSGFNGSVMRTPTKDHWTNVSGAFSSESSRPLLNSSESGSTCDGSIEIPVSIKIREEQNKENLCAWPSSTLSNKTSATIDEKMSMTSTDLDSAETLSIAISDIPEHHTAAGSEAAATPLWGWPEKCHSADITRFSDNNVFVHDANLASRFLAESLYDKPRNFQAENGRFNKVNDECVNEGNWTNTFPRVHRLQLNSVSSPATVHSTPASSPRRIITSSTTLHHNHQLNHQSLDIPTFHDSCSALSSPSRKCMRRRTDGLSMIIPPAEAYSNLQTNNDSIPAQSPCSCQNSALPVNAYGNYDIPKFALCPLVPKVDPQVRNVSPLRFEDGGGRQRMSIISANGTDYDVPKRIKDSLQEEVNFSNNSCVDPSQWPTTKIEESRESVGHLHHVNVVPVVSSCVCQRVLHWAENLLVCQRPLSGNSNVQDVSKCILTNNTCPHCCDDQVHDVRHFVDTKLQPSEGNSVLQIVQHCMCTHVIPSSFTSTLLRKSPQTCSRNLADNRCSHQSPNVQMLPGIKSTEANYVNLEYHREVTASNDIHEKTSMVMTRNSSTCNGDDETVIYTQPDPVIDSNVKVNNYICYKDASETKLKSVAENSEGESDTINNSSNYLMMQPCSLKDDSNRTENEPCQTYNAMVSTEPPLRPFLPLTVPQNYCQLIQLETGVSETDGKAQRKDETNKEVEYSCSSPNRARSNSVVELKKRVMLKRRSSSADSHQAQKGLQDPNFVFSRNIAHQRDTCWPSAENVAREIDLSNGSRLYLADKSIDDHNLVFATNSTVESRRSLRSSCKSASNRDSASSSDSGVSAGSPKQTEVIGNIDNVNEDHVTTMKDANFISNEENLQEDIALMEKLIDQQPCGEPSCLWCNRKQLRGCTSSSSLVDRESREHSSKSSSQRNNGSSDSKSTASSSTMSDMSDYIETLSLSSHSSSGDSQLDLQTVRSSHGSTTNTLRPRSRKEYQQIERYSRLTELSVGDQPTAHVGYSIVRTQVHSGSHFLK